VERGLLFQLGGLVPAAFSALRDQVALAEALAMDSVWCLPGAGGAAVGWPIAAPEIWLAGLAGSSARIRLGWGLAGLWPPREAPVREAEQAASLDVASGGRLELALLPDARPEAGPAAARGAAADERGGADEGARMLVDMWAPATFSWTSPRFAVPPIDVVPKPLQRPHPPLWLVGWTEAHAAAAGRAGLAFLDASGAEGQPLADHRVAYRAGRAQAAPDALVGPPTWAVAVASPEEVPALAALGVERAVLQSAVSAEAHPSACERIRAFAAVG